MSGCRSRSEIEQEIRRIDRMSTISVRAMRTLGDAMLWAIGESEQPVSERMLPPVPIAGDKDETPPANDGPGATMSQKTMKRQEVRVGQVWRNTTRGYRVRVEQIDPVLNLTHCLNLESGRQTSIALDRFNTKCHWRLHRQAPADRTDQDVVVSGS